MVDEELGLGDFVVLVCPAGFFGQAEVDIEEAFLVGKVVEVGEVDLDVTGFTGWDVGERDGVACSHRSIGCDLEVSLVVVERGERMSVADLEEALGGVDGGDENGLVGGLDFVEGRVGGAVRLDEAVAVEVAV
ncbi:MAG: hypothetical protein RI897_3228 [Verrucomicrobiota bacterium]